MKLLIEVEIKEGKGKHGPKGNKRGSKVLSVKCNGKQVEPDYDSVGRADGIFYPLPSVENDDIFQLELVQWLG